jgi:hypothetical protein
MAHSRVGGSLVAILFSIETCSGPQSTSVRLPQLIWHKPAFLPYDDAAPMGGIALSTAAQVSRRLSLKIEYY